MKTLLAVLIAIFSLGCTSIKKKTDHMHAGTPKEDFLRVLGEPLRTAEKDGAEILSYHDRDWNCDFAFKNDAFVSRSCAVDTGPELTPEERAAKRARFQNALQSFGNSSNSGQSYGEYWLKSQPEKTTCTPRTEFGKTVYDCEKQR